MLPQLGVGGGTPTPTKLSAASMKMFDAAYKGRQRGRAKEMWHFSHEVNFAKVAEAMGCVGFRVERPEDIRPALEKALHSNSPAVVEVISDVDAMPQRAWRPA
jgi:thiamine pyrophosphate-dependent acetolactate synthase large subunit-like protein